MNTHKNARLTPFGRRVLVERILFQGMSVKDAADASAVST
ncbi:MAG: leucine zipper domain-containing protein, partial [Pseudomonadota bacterium]